jgi:hypothetical protein
MSVLNNFFGARKNANPTAGGPETTPARMNLDERMELRRELLYEAIRITMQAHGILSASYRFRVVRNDKRGHRYLVVVDLSTDFLHNHQGRPAQLAALGRAMAENAAARYKLMVTGVYWQVNEQLQGFEVSRPDAKRTDGVARVSGEGSPRRGLERASAEEFAALEAAWQRGQDIQLRDRVYASDLAPLGGDTEAGDSTP